jgi:hypothetical protein
MGGKKLRGPVISGSPFQLRIPVGRLQIDKDGIEGAASQAKDATDKAKGKIQCGLRRQGALRDDFRF